jgi:hypothetical protein
MTINKSVDSLSVFVSNIFLVVYCHKRLSVQLSTERPYSGDSYFREQGFYSNKFTWHFPMDPNACLCDPSQLGVTQTFPQVSLTLRRLLSQWGGRSCTPGDPHSHLQCRSSSWFTGDTQWSSGEGACSQAVAASMSGSWVDSDSMVSNGKEASKALGSGLSLYTLWWPHHFCYPLSP